VQASRKLKDWEHGDGGADIGTGGGPAAHLEEVEDVGSSGSESSAELEEEGSEGEAGGGERRREGGGEEESGGEEDYEDW
jgi:hypothetical protein